MLGRLVAGLTVGLELAWLGFALWKILDPEAPELAELGKRAYSKLEQEAQYREAIRRTLDSIRSLPETGEE